MKATSSNEWCRTKNADQTEMQIKQNKCRSNTLCRTNADQKIMYNKENLSNQTNLLNHHV